MLEPRCTTLCRVSSTAQTSICASLGALFHLYCLVGVTAQELRSQVPMRLPNAAAQTGPGVKPSFLGELTLSTGSKRNSTHLPFIGASYDSLCRLNYSVRSEEHTSEL